MTGKTVKFADISTEGITKINNRDFEYAKKMGKSIKLIAVAEESDGVACIVAPFMIGADHPFNGIFVHGNVLGDAMFYGQGAGKLATASAVVADVVDMARNMGRELPCVWDEEKLELADYKKLVKRFFVRAAVKSRGEVLNTFGSIDEVDLFDEEFAFITSHMSEHDFDKKIANIKGVIKTIRVED